MKVGIVTEHVPGERRVALTPDAVAALIKSGPLVQIERGAGRKAGFVDEAYEQAGASLTDNRGDVLAHADVLLQVWTFAAHPEVLADDVEHLRNDQTVVGLCDPLSGSESIQQLADRGVTCFALELMPRITRAQSMDALSSQATVAGYKAVVLAADHLPKMFPMMMTAAGTISPARVLVLGAGVAGLQAIATARKLGAVVSAYDIRPAVKEQVESLGARFLELELEAAETETASGYAREMDEAFYARQREMLAKAVAEHDVVITTALVPGRPSPVLVTAEMVQTMRPGSVIVDLAAERGGNCELTKADEAVVEHNVTILGPTNLPATVPYHASQMYARNITSFLRHLMKGGELTIDTEDEITRETLLTRGGKVVHPRVSHSHDGPTE